MGILKIQVNNMKMDKDNKTETIEYYRENISEITEILKFPMFTFFTAFIPTYKPT